MEPGAIRVVELLERDYARVLELQRALALRVAAGEEPPTLLVLEHDPVVTVGRGNQRPPGAPAPGPAAPPERPGRPVFRVERGGGVTYHGPGQLVGYPIVKLADHDVRGFIRRLERGLLGALEALGLRGATRPEATGVWIGERKIASIGIAVRRWVTFHGFALNVSTDLSGFEGLAPCGFDARIMTSVERELRRPMPLVEAKPIVIRAVLEALQDA